MSTVVVGCWVSLLVSCWLLTAAGRLTAVVGCRRLVGQGGWLTVGVRASSLAVGCWLAVVGWSDSARRRAGQLYGTDS